jgi:arginyl-tRNA synthetase
MSYLQEIKKELADFLGLESTSFSLAPNIELGHLSLAIFKVKSEILNKKKDLILNDKKWSKIIEEIKIVGPYLNIYFKKEIFNTKVLLFDENYGDYPKNEKKLMLEFANLNTHKEVHIGHIRNISYGDSVVKLLTNAGFEVIPVSFINDFGINTAKTIWLWKKEKNLQNTIEYNLGECYSQAVKQLENNDKGKQEVSAIMQEIEKKEGENYQIWQETRQLSINYFSQIYQELDIFFKHTFYESELLDQGLKLVQELLDKKIFKYSQGAVIADLDKYDLGIMPIIRSDKTALYPVADLALALVKSRLYHLNESIYVIDVRQSLHFKQLFKILELWGFKERMRHLSYDFVKLKSGMMSSRSGNVITYQDAYQQVFNLAQKTTKKKQSDWTTKEVQIVANVIALNTLKFEMIKVSSEKVIMFDPQEFLRFDGYTAVYLLYTYTRINSLLSKVKSSKEIKKIINLNLRKEQELILQIALFPDKAQQAALDYNPAVLARYLYDLSAKFNDYYQSVNILQSESEVQAERIILIGSIKKIIEKCFSLLGLKTIDKM